MRTNSRQTLRVVPSKIQRCVCVCVCVCGFADIRLGVVPTSTQNAADFGGRAGLTLSWGAKGRCIAHPGPVILAARSMHLHSILVETALAMNRNSTLEMDQVTLPGLPLWVWV
ncbi:hypothetical protein BO71DRAFT_109682 [Aspergillus ellipticus CBS 707.79]|uniref:Uncharacterized protein n=1 Tax=Aspergillus ellipticus CBS 707.79 TaxID=1448320 RepID=A0A319CWH3_9EURO|nr:hypothetical protein BO71DRAFT_109682 [Aspergillus ellipticus CBS 707.79]